MDKWLDEVARTLARGASRRRLLKMLGTGALGAVFMQVVSPEASADNLCKPSGNLPQSKCNKNEQCCSGNCTDGRCQPQRAGCTSDADCNDGNDCTEDHCVHGSGGSFFCIHGNLSGTPCNGGAGTCQSGVCVT